MRIGGKRDSNVVGKGSKTSNVNDDIDALYRLPLAEFIGARKTLAAQLKKSGHRNEAESVKALVKPSISAWTVNQLYWKHREPFDRLMTTGQHFRQAQSSRLPGKVADMRVALETRRETLAELSDLATELLHDAGHNPSLETLRRITTTLEAMSAYASLPNAPVAGRLSHDVDPPGFESLASAVPSSGTSTQITEPARATPSKSGTVATDTPRKAAVSDRRALEQTRQARIAAAKGSLQDAKRALTEARARAHSAQLAQKKAEADAKAAEKLRREAEQRLEKARGAAEDAARRARDIADDVEKAANAMQDAEKSVKEASKELESAFRELPAN